MVQPGMAEPGRPVDPTLSSELMSYLPATHSRGPLHAGATWEGVQRSGRNSYAVKVTIEAIDLLGGTLSGLLQIKGLTPELESLVTFFDGEIIGDQGNGFLTGRWGATEADDMKHWARFPAFRGIRNQLTKPNLNFNHLNKNFLFMRWKEKFVVPDQMAQNINGASFAGFYYLCLNLGPASPYDIPPPLSPFSSRPRVGSRSLSTVVSSRQSHPAETSRALSHSPSSHNIDTDSGSDTQSSSSADSVGTGANAVVTNLSTSSRINEETTFSQGENQETSEGEEGEETVASTATPLVRAGSRPPIRPRSASSSSSISYAAVVRGLSPPPPGSAFVVGAQGDERVVTTTTASTQPFQLSNSSMDGSAPPKEYDGELHQQQQLQQQRVSEQGLFSLIPEANTIMIPTPPGTTFEDFPVPSSPPLNTNSPRLGSGFWNASNSTTNANLSHPQTLQNGVGFGHGSSIQYRQQQQEEESRNVRRNRRLSSHSLNQMATVIATGLEDLMLGGGEEPVAAGEESLLGNVADSGVDSGRRSRSRISIGYSRQGLLSSSQQQQQRRLSGTNALNGVGGGRGGGRSTGAKERERERERECWGMKSWTQATMTGYYYFRGSEPFQELTLSYVPQNRGGTEAFSFR